nr:reverse transcriptase domain-containing protein [Tanacetum cinerariifolium]
EQKERPMPVWCKMFRQTLSGSARNWFDSLDPKSVDGFEELSNKFLKEFSQQKRQSRPSSGERQLPTQPKSSDLLGRKRVLNSDGKIGNYTMEDEVLYRKSYLVPLMRCVGPLQSNYVIRKVHIGSCEMHDGPRQVVAKSMNLGYYWPSMHKDARELIKACDDYQTHAFVPRLPKAYMISVTSAWPFMKFRIPATIITENGTQFVNDPFKKWAEKLKIQLISTLVYPGE